MKEDAEVVAKFVGIPGTMNALVQLTLSTADQEALDPAVLEQVAPALEHICK